jgi:hypothetical protein
MLRVRPGDFEKGLIYPASREFQLSATVGCFSKCQASVKKSVNKCQDFAPFMGFYYRLEWVDIARQRRDTESPAERLQHLKNGSRRALGRSGFEPLKA